MTCVKTDRERAKQKAWREANREILRVKRRARRNTPHGKAQRKEQYFRHKALHAEQIKERRIRYQNENREKCRAANRSHYHRNREEVLARQKIYEQANRDKIRERRRKRCQRDPAYRIRKTLQRKMLLALQRQKGTKRNRTLELTGCTIDFLMQFLAAQFKRGMTWENHGTIWHIDHVMPCASFNLLDVRQQRACFHYSNLQPLFCEHNLRKASKLPAPHQALLL